MVPSAGPSSSVSSLLPISLQNGVSRKGDKMTRRGMVAALAYMSCADVPDFTEFMYKDECAFGKVLLVMFNKAALSVYKFPCANVITLLQVICATTLLYILRSWNIITFSIEVADSPGKGFVPLRTIRQALPLSIAYLLYMVAGMASIRGVNVPMYTTLRRTTVLFTMVMEYFLAGKKHSPAIVCSVGVIVVGAFIAGARDFSFDLQGYALVILSNVTTAIYLAVIARVGKATSLNSFGLMWCNGLICGPLLCLWTWLSGELGVALYSPALYVLAFQVVLVLSCILAFFLNYTIFLNTSLNSPLTQTMCGNLKDLGTVFFGWLWFGGLPFDWLNVFGQFLGFLGSGIYAYCRLKGK